MNRISKCLFGGALVSAGIVASASAQLSTFGSSKNAVPGPGKDYQILWDQSAFNPNLNSFVDQDFSDYAAYSTFMVDDFSTGGKTWNITSVHTFYTKQNGGWNQNITSGMLQFYPKNGALPSNANDTAPEYKVAVQVIDHGTYMEVAATGLNIPELLGVNGDFWIGLTPTAAFGQFGQEFHLQLDPGFFGDLAALRNPGGGFGLGTNWNDVSILSGQKSEMAFYLDGDIVPAPGAAALLGLGGLMAGRRRRA